MQPSAAEIIGNAKNIRFKFRNNPDAVPDHGIDLTKRPRLGFQFVQMRKPEPIVAKPKRIPIIAVQKAQTVEINREPRKPTIHSIIRLVARHFSVGVSDITGQARHMPLVRYRQIAVYLCREVLLQFYSAKSLKFSYPKIARCMGGRDHTTAIAAFNKIAELLSIDDDLAWDVAHLEAELTRGQA